MIDSIKFVTGGTYFRGEIEIAYASYASILCIYIWFIYRASLSVLVGCCGIIRGECGEISVSECPIISCR